jgi:predicted flap endonuclease-1-like 5' DNA nuclease
VNQSSARSLTVITLLVAALFVAMMRIVQSAPLGDWWLVAALLLLAVLITLPERMINLYNAALGRSAAEAPAASTLNVYTAPAAEQPKRAYPPPPSPTAEMDNDYELMRDREASADAMASATHLETDEALENEGMVENVMSAGATGEHHEVDEIAGGPTKSISKTQEMRAVASVPDVPLPATSAEDDLTIVEGIGPKMSAALKTAGIKTFTQLQSATLPDLEAAISAAGMRFAPSMPTWAEQAGYAVRGDSDGLKAFQKTLKSGRKK